MILDTIHATNSPLNQLLKSDAMKDALLRAAAKMQTQTPVLEAAPVPEPSPAPKESAPDEKEENKKDPDDSDKPNPNSAVERCIQAFCKARDEGQKAGQSYNSYIESAQSAFRLAIPPLDNPESVPNFIACVTRGMLNGSIPTKDASRYLYAAQVVAQTTSLGSKDRSSSRPAGRPHTRLVRPTINQQHSPRELTC